MKNSQMEDKIITFFGSCQIASVNAVFCVLRLWIDRTANMGGNIKLGRIFPSIAKPCGVTAGVNNNRTNFICKQVNNLEATSYAFNRLTTSKQQQLECM